VSTEPGEVQRDGKGGSSYINVVILRDKDANTAWTSASDSTLEERFYLCQNWRGDVVALVNSAHKLAEWDKYLSYGTPFGLPGADTDSDGDCDSTDITQIQTWIDAPAYDVRGDVDLDADVDGTDKTTAQNNLQGITLALNSLSWRNNRFSYSGSWSVASPLRSHMRQRDLISAFGMWARRDPTGFVDSANLYEYVASRPTLHVDPFGLGVGNGVGRNSSTDPGVRVMAVGERADGTGAVVPLGPGEDSGGKGLEDCDRIVCTCKGGGDFITTWDIRDYSDCTVSCPDNFLCEIDCESFGWGRCDPRSPIKDKHQKWRGSGGDG
jgi:RHS repeat-associated protein